MSASADSKSRRRGPGFDPESIVARQRFMKRIVKIIENIVRWRKYTKERDGLGLIATDLVGTILYPVAQEGWEVGGEENIRKV
jgi:GC-rich sequence DNA-binding factor